MKKKSGKGLLSAVITVAVFCCVAVIYSAEGFNWLENKTYDARVVLLSGLRPPSDDIVLILLDQASLDWGRDIKGWSWPWPRSAYGNIVRFMEKAGAAVVVFDVLYTEPSIYGPADDENFASAARDYGRVVQTVFFDSASPSESADVWPEELKKPFFIMNDFEKTQRGIFPYTKALFPVLPIAGSAAMLGSITSRPDKDSIYRRSPSVYTFDGHTIPSLSLAALAAAEGGSPFIRWNKKNNTVEWNGYSIPAAPDGTALLRFRGSLDRYIPYNAAQILMSYDAVSRGEEPLLEPDIFAGKYVFFGFYAPGLYDIFATPVSGTYAGAGIHVTMLDNILQNDFIRAVSRLPVLLYILLAAAAGAFWVFYLESIHHRLIALATGFICIIGAGFAAYAVGFRVPIVAPSSALIISYASAFLVIFNTEGRQKRYLKAAFRQYLSPVVIEELIAHPERLKLGGERREISIYFSDIQGFTSISEKLSPEELTELLNEYLSVMSDIILDSGGTIDKYEGDAVIAFWNAPLSQSDHAVRSLLAAMECQRRLEELRPQFSGKAGRDLYMRIGLNTGYAVVGNMGSSKRFDYTMLGDSVNLAARLEGLNKQFGTYTMCTDALRQAALQNTPEGALLPYFRELARVTVVGKKEAVTIFEPISIVDYAARKDVFAVFDRGRSLFYMGDFTSAAVVFDTIADCDRPSLFYAEKCRGLAAAPPADWQGVWQSTTK